MGLFDVDGIGFKNKEKPKKENSFDMGVDISKVDNSLVNTNKTSGSDFDKTLVGEINPLVKVDVINHYFRLSDLLKEYGCYIDGSTMYCPFHDDDITCFNRDICPISHRNTDVCCRKSWRIIHAVPYHRC